MQNLRLVTLLSLLTALGAGCGSTTATMSVSEPQEIPIAEPAAFSWQAGLDDTELGKITQPIWLWLDGDQVASLDGEAGRVRVSAVFARPMHDDDIGHYASLGLEAEAGVRSVSGLLSKDQALSLARDPNVLYLVPAPTRAPTTLAGTPDGATTL